MASGGEVSGASQSSDSVRDFTCTKCDQGNSAAFYCPQCREFYCMSCLQFLCSHGVLGRNATDRWLVDRSSTVVPPAGEVACLRHPGRTLEMYCGIHDVACCRLCSAKSHRSCVIKSIKEVNTSSVDDGEISKLQTEIKQFQVTMQQITTSRRTKKSKLGESRVGCEKEIRDYCSRLREILNDLERETLEKLDSKFDTKSTKLQADIDVCDHMEKDIEQLQQTIDENAEKATVFLRIKRDKEWLHENQQLLDDMEQEKKGIKELVFVQDKKIEEFLSSSGKLGNLRGKHVSWKATNKQMVNIKTSQNKSGCEIRNIQQLKNGCFVVADVNNKCVKQLNKDYNIINTCPLSASPNDICCVGASEVAVSLDNKTIQFISVDDGLTLSRSITVDHDCFGVAHKDDKLYVTDNSKSLYVYSLSGSRLQTFSKDKHGIDLFVQSYRIAFSLDGNRMYVTDHKRGLVTLDMHGNKLATFQSEDLSCADGVCVAEDGSVIVSGYSNTKNVIQLTAEGDEMIGEIMPKAAGVDPHGICIDRNRLLVANCSQNRLSVFDFVEEDI